MGSIAFFSAFALTTVSNNSNIGCADLIMSKENLGLLYGRYFEKEASYLSEIVPGQLLRLYLNFNEYEILIETKLCSYFTAFLNNGQQPASD